MTASALLFAPLLLALEDASVPPPTPAPTEPAADAARPESKREERSKTSSSGFSLKTGLGGNYAELAGVPTYGGEFSLALGGGGMRAGKGFMYGAVHVERGRSEHGLDYWGVHLGPSLELPFGVARFGAEARVGGMGVQRVTSDDTMDGFSLGAALQASVDVLTLSDQNVLFVQAALRGDAYGEDLEVLMWGPNLTLGYRWDP